MNRIEFRQGTIELRDCDDVSKLPEGFVEDRRSDCLRAPADLYATTVMSFVRRKVDYEDCARQYSILPEGLKVHRQPRPFQSEALGAWRNAKRRGVVVLPTGAGKSYVAQMAIDDARRSTLIVVPTLDLVRQWAGQLKNAFPYNVGIIGGGEHQVEQLTVTTYDSAYIHMEHIGNRFGLVVFDECHHLPGEAYAQAARSCLAPFRLGLTATPERADGKHSDLEALIGPIVYRNDVADLAGDYLAEYTTERIYIDLSPDEWAAYEEARSTYRNFVLSQGIRIGSPQGWQEFIKRSARTEQGRNAMKAYRRQRQLAFAAPSKLDYVQYLLDLHYKDRVLIFTDMNDTAYEVSRRFLVPVITHQTKLSERTDILEGFSEGRYTVLSTSKVLNEGVDVPDANVAIVISGSGSVREHVQRLGRILRKRGDKRAVLYELIAADTAEAYTSERRRDHNAYR